MQPETGIAITLRKFAHAHILELADPRDAVLGEARLQRLAGAADKSDRLVAQERLRFGSADHGEAARLVELGGELREELVVTEADRGGDPELVLDALRELRHRLRGRASVQPLGAGKIEIGLVQRK